LSAIQDPNEDVCFSFWPAPLTFSYWRRFLFLFQFCSA
jgi:hypothetical protein